MIYTSSHKYWNNDELFTCAISGNRGMDAGYEGKCYPKLAPKYAFWKIWHDNIGKISIEENTKFYISEYWMHVLSKLDPQEVYEELDGMVLLCYEENDAFCHRHIVAVWLELSLGVVVPEIKRCNNKIEIIERPEYIKKYLIDVLENTTVKCPKCKSK